MNGRYGNDVRIPNFKNPLQFEEDFLFHKKYNAQD